MPRKRFRVPTNVRGRSGGGAGGGGGWFEVEVA